MTVRRTVHGIDLTAPGGVERLLTHHRRRWGAATMTAPTGEQQQTGQQQNQNGGQQQGGQQGGDGGQQRSESNNQQQDGPRFTQADLDRIIGERLSAEKAKYEQQVKDAQALAGKNETEKLTIERDQAQQRAAEAQQRASERVAKTEAKVAAIAAGANPERVAAIVRNADLAAAVKDGEVDEAAIKTAVEKVLADFPEWKTGGGQQVTSQSGGELNGGGNNGKPTFTRKQLEQMPPDEMARRIDEINAAMADGRVTG